MKRLLKGIGRFILAVIAAVIVLCAVGMCLSIFGDNHIVWYLPLKIWVDHKEESSKLPESGSYYCEELQLTVTFGRETQLLFPDGEYVALSIDYGGNVRAAFSENIVIHAGYTARLSKGYFILKFSSLPIEFKEGRAYRFYLIEDDASATQ